MSNNIDNYVKTNLKKGFSLNAIKKKLRQEGVNEEEVKKFTSKYEKSNQKPSKTYPKININLILIVLGIIILVSVIAYLGYKPSELDTSDEIDEIIMKAREAFKNEDYGLAMDYFNKALEIEDTFDSHEGLCAVYMRLDQYENAIQECKKAIRIDNSSSSPYHALGIAYSELDDFFRANHYLIIANRLEHYNPRYYEDLVKLYLDNNKFDLAIIYAQKALHYRKASPTTLKYAAEAYHNKGLYQDEIKMLMFALEINKKDPEIYASLASAHIKLNNFSEAKSYIDQALELDPNNQDYISLNEEITSSL